MRIGEAAGRAGVTASRIRYYERVGLLPPPERLAGQRRYDATILRRLAAIDAGRHAGLRLGEIKRLLDPGDAPMGAALRELSTAKLVEVDGLLEHLRRVRAWHEAAQRCDCPTVDACALFDAA